MIEDSDGKESEASMECNSTNKGEGRKHKKKVGEKGHRGLKGCERSIEAEMKKSNSFQRQWQFVGRVPMKGKISRKGSMEVRRSIK